MKNRPRSSRVCEVCGVRGRGLVMGDVNFSAQRSVFGLVGMSACGLAVSALLLTGCNKKNDANVTPAVGAGTETAEGAVSSARPVGGFDADLLERLPSLARIEQALDGAPVNINIVRGEQLEHARDWIAENHPEISEREAEMLAQMLLIVEDLLEAGGVSLAKMVGMGESQLLQLWSMDADGDGKLSDEEARGSLESMMSMQKVAAEYNMDRFDTDGDGEVSDTEAMAMQEQMMQNMMPLMDTMIERAGLVNWDTNKDGILSDAEKAVGEETLEFTDWDGDGEYSDMERVGAYTEFLQELNQGLVLIEQPDMAEIQAEMQAEMMARMEEMNSPIPSRADFDLDGDGLYSEIETNAFDAEMEAFQASRLAISAEMQEATQGMVTRMMRMQFDTAVTKLDGDGDGLLMNEEWEAGYVDLRGERDARMFNYLYDADRSGSVTDGEVARFMDSYDQQSIYADANLDGKVDVSDLQFFVSQVSGG